MALTVCPDCQGKVGEGLTLCPHCYGNLGAAPPRAKPAPSILDRPYQGSAQSVLLWGVCALLIGGMAWGSWSLTHQSRPLATENFTLDSQGQTVNLPGVVEQSRRALEAQDFAEAARQANAGLAFLRLPGERGQAEADAELALRQILAESELAQGKGTEAAVEYQWLVENDAPRAEYYRARLVQLGRTGDRADNQAALADALQKVNRAQVLAGDGHSQEALALGSEALATFESAGVEPREIAKLCVFVANGHFALGDRGNAQSYLRRAASYGYFDPRLNDAPAPAAKPSVDSSARTADRLPEKRRVVQMLQPPPNYPTYQHSASARTAPRPLPHPVAATTPHPEAAPRAPRSAPPRVVLPKIVLPEAARDTLPTYHQNNREETLPGYNASPGSSTLPGYDTDKKQP